MRITERYLQHIGSSRRRWNGAFARHDHNGRRGRRFRALGTSPGFKRLPVSRSGSSQTLRHLLCELQVRDTNAARFAGKAIELGAQMVTKYIPFLRRYARALTGTQTAGDACVAATLQALVQHPALVDTEHLRVELFRLFTRIWGSISDDASAKSNRVQSLSEQWLANLTPLSRQAFLLMALEGFSETEAVRVLECDVKTLRCLVAEAGRELASEIATDVLI